MIDDVLHYVRSILGILFSGGAIVMIVITIASMRKYFQDKSDVKKGEDVIRKVMDKYIPTAGDYRRSRPDWVGKGGDVDEPTTTTTPTPTTLSQEEEDEINLEDTISLLHDLRKRVDDASGRKKRTGGKPK